MESRSRLLEFNAKSVPESLIKVPVTLEPQGSKLMGFASKNGEVFWSSRLSILRSRATAEDGRRGDDFLRVCPSSLFKISKDDHIPLR